MILCRGLIRTHVELHQTGTFEGRLYWLSYSATANAMTKLNHWKKTWTVVNDEIGMGGTWQELNPGPLCHESAAWLMARLKMSCRCQLHDIYNHAELGFEPRTVCSSEGSWPLNLLLFIFSGEHQTDARRSTRHFPLWLLNSSQVMNDKDCRDSSGDLWRWKSNT